MAQWVGYVLEGVDYLSRLLGFLPLPAGVAGPISLAPPIAAAVQFAWRVLRESGREHKKRVLRERIVGLREFIESLPGDEASPDEAQAGRDARTEWSTAIEKLALLRPRLARVVDDAVHRRHWLRQALLLYSPTPGALWVLHAVFYFCVLQAAAMLSVLAVSLVQGNFTTAAVLAPAVTLFLIPTLVFWGLAADLDRSTARSRNAVQRWLLAYAPDHRSRWVWHVLFYVSLAASVSILGIVPEGGGDTNALLLAAGVWVLLLLLSRAMALRSRSGAIPRSWWERCLLAYVPKRRPAWFLHAAFWTFLIGTVAALVTVLGTAMRGEESTLSGLWLTGYTAMVAVIAWGLATDLEQRRLAPPSDVRRWLLLYVPARRSLWITHLFSYLCAITAVVGLGEIVTGRFQTTPASFAAVPILYFVLAALVSRGASVGLEPGVTVMPRPTVWLRIGQQPRSWMKRLLFWVGAALFYGLVFLLPLVVYLTVLDGSVIFVVRGLLPLVAVGGAARWMVHRIDDRRDRIEPRPSEPAAV